MFVCPPDHAHGRNTTCWSGHRCRCDECRQAHRNRMRRYRKNVAYGRHQPLVDNAPAREHLLKLRAAGWTLQEMWLAAGVANQVVISAMYHPGRRIRPENLEAILAVDPEQRRPVGPGKLVDATGTRRRLQALMWLGWSGAELLRRLGGNDGYMWRLLTFDRVTAGMRARVAALYDQLWDTPPTPRNGLHRAAIEKTRRRARELGWVGPLAWDDDAIDDPDATPVVDVPLKDDTVDDAVVDAAVRGEKPHMKPVERWEAIRRLNDEFSWSAARIAEWLGCSERTVNRARERMHLRLPEHIVGRGAA